jgi:hypothetical protein
MQACVKSSRVELLASCCTATALLGAVAGRTAHRVPRALTRDRGSVGAAQLPPVLDKCCLLAMRPLARFLVYRFFVVVFRGKEREADHKVSPV